MASPYRGSDSRNIPVRPLDKGMFRDRQTQLIPPGGFYTIKNYVAGKEGLTRIGSFGLYGGGEVLEGNFIDMVTLWTTDNAQLTFVVTDKFVYRVNPLTGFAPVYWAIEDETFYNSGGTIFTTATALTNEFVQSGHLFQVTPTNDRVLVETVRDTSGSLAGTYFRIDDEYYAWYEVSGSGTDPGAAGTGIKVTISTDDNGTIVALNTATAINGNAAFDAVEYGGTNRLSIRRVVSHDMSGAAAETSGFSITHFDEITVDGDYFTIDSFTDTDLVLETALSVDYPKLTNFRLIRTFNVERPYMVDHEVIQNELVFACINAPLLVYDDATDRLVEYIDDPSYYIRQDLGGIKFQCESIAYYKNRVYVGHTIDSDEGDIRQRIRWSTATNPRDFSDETAFLDLPELGGSLKRLLPMGNILVAYFNDGVYFGTSSNIVDLPLTFQRVETGGNGLVGSKAVTSWLNGHYYVSQDDVYFISNSGPKRIGSPIARDTIAKSLNLWRSYAVIDPLSYRIVFGFPENNEYIEKIWSYEYRVGAWSYSDIQTYMVANPLVNYSLTWNDLTPTWDELVNYDYSWDALESDENLRKLFIEHNNKLYLQTGIEGILYGDETTPIGTQLITGDVDLDGPDTIKTVTRLSMKITSEYGYSDGINFTVYGSSNRGRDYKRLGVLRIRPGFDEGHVNFRLTGSTFRFKIESDSIVNTYVINEMVVKVVPRGSELSLGTQE